VRAVTPLSCPDACSAQRAADPDHRLDGGLQRIVARCAAPGTTAHAEFLGKRILQLIPTLFFVSILIFSLQQLLPGDPALVMAGEERDPDVIAQIRQQYRLDQPIPVQYVYWVKGVLSGDFGESLRIKVPVRELIAQKLPVTIQLASMAIVIAFLIGIPAGIVSAVKKGTPGTMARTCSRSGASRRRISGSGSC
jgi:ABC-type dipeptide/oligopeptide/nickel transport system permease component